MRTRILGRTGIAVGEIGLGCEGFAGKSAQTCQAMVDRAMSLGVNYYDMYTSDPEIRRHVGGALARFPRERYAVQGHLCTVWKDGQYCRTRKLPEVREGFASLLSEMQLTFVDVGMIHYCDTLPDWSEIVDGGVLDYARELQKSGMIRSIGLSTHNTEVARLAVESGAVNVLMMSVNPAYDMLPPTEDVEQLFAENAFAQVYRGIDPRREQLYRLAESRGVALTVMKSLAGGLLLDAKQTPFSAAMTPVQCMSYCLDRPAVCCVLAGAASIAEMEAAAAYETASAAERDYSRILADTPSSSFSGHCMYCGHCAPCTAKIDIAAVNRYLDLAQAQGAVTETLREHYTLLPHHAGECVACGRCEKNCPFGVEIIRKMTRAAEVFGQ